VDNCSTCSFGKLINLNTLECYFNPPTLVKIGGKLKTLRPKVSNEDFCSYHKPSFKVKNILKNDIQVYLPANPNFIGVFFQLTSDQSKFVIEVSRKQYCLEEALDEFLKII